ncbi:MAG: hypothetical protein JOZ25_11605 [Actinobacteria bacterium]|nr:hypothetical protein [Actinomycetota bacterium]
MPRCGSRGAPPAWKHVVWIVMENHAYGEVIGSGDAPYINRLAHRCGLATNYRAVTHPSLPNYVAMTSGGTHGIGDDAPPSVDAISSPSIFSQLGGGWRAYAESMPGRCRRSDSGEYAVRHNPATYFTSLDAICSRHDRPLPRSPTLKRFTFVTPNLCDDMHDCSTATGDRWLQGFVPKLLRLRDYRNGSTAIFITWDEDDGTPGNRVPLLVLARSVPHRARSGVYYTHYSLLRTTEEMLGLAPLGRAGSAGSMRGAFGL